MKEGSFGDVICVGEEGEGGIEDETEVADLGGGGDNGAVDGEGEVLSRAGEGFGADDDEF